MKKLIFVFCTIFIFANSTFAQNAPTPAKESVRTEKNKKHANAGKAMKKRLGLSAEQGTKMKAIGDNTKARMQAIRTDNTLSKAQKKERSKAIRAEADSEVSKILTAEQRAEWEKMKAERKAAHKGEGAPRKGGK